MVNKKGTNRKPSLTINSRLLVVLFQNDILNSYYRPAAKGRRKSLTSTKPKIPGAKRKPTKVDKETNKQVEKVEAINVIIKMIIVQNTFRVLFRFW